MTCQTCGINVSPTSSLLHRAEGHVIQEQPINRRPCCGEYAFVVTCDGEIDLWECPVCDLTWEAECR